MMHAELLADGQKVSAKSVRVEQINDKALIVAALRHPRIYPHVSDDGCPDAMGLDIVPMPGAFFLGAFDEAEYLGCFFVQRHNFVLYEVHTCLMPNAWGARSRLATKACADWLFGCTPCVRIITTVPVGNALALRLAHQSGMVEYGRNPRSMLKGGELVDTVMLGMSKE